MSKIIVEKEKIEQLREEGKTAEEISTILDIPINEYKTIVKLFGIKGKPKVSLEVKVKSKYELVS